MRIYATSNIDIYKKYAGKDVWLRCFHEDNGYGYIRILSKYEGKYSQGLYVCNRIWDWALEKFEPSDTFNPFHAYIIDPHTFEICQPVQEYQSSDLIPEYVSNEELLRRYIGKNIWVLFEDPSDGSQFYVKIRSRKDDFIIVSIINSAFIDGTCENYYDFTWEEVMAALSRPLVASIDEWPPVLPINVLSDEEILECLEEYHDYFGSEEE